MKFSIIIPTFNRADYLIEAVDSALQQTYTNFEVIVVDDGSSDNTGALIKERYGKEPKVNYYYKQNEERGAARNFGLQKATGEYVVFFDSDDWMLPGYLQILGDAINTQPAGPELLAAKYTFRDEKGKEWNSSMEHLAEGWYGIELFLRGNPLACNFCVKRTAPGLSPFPPERYLASMEDWLFLLKNLVDREIYIAGSSGVVMREHTGRSMANNRKIIEARKRATQWALEHINLTPAQQRELVTYSEYFYGIHEYIEGSRKEAIRQSIAAIRSGGIKANFVLLLLKSLVGKKTIDRIKHYAS